MENFPGSSVVKTLPSNAGSAGSIPGQEAKIPHAVGQLICATATTGPESDSVSRTDLL